MAIESFEVANIKPIGGEYEVLFNFIDDTGAVITWKPIYVKAIVSSLDRLDDNLIPAYSEMAPGAYAYNANAHGAALVAEMNGIFANREISAAWGEIRNNGADPMSISLRYATRKQAFKKWLRSSMMDNNPKLILKISDALLSYGTPEQIAIALDLTPEVADRIRQRIVNVRSIRAELEADDAMVEDVYANLT